MRGRVLAVSLVALSLIMLGAMTRDGRAQSTAPVAHDQTGRADVWFSVEDKAGQCVSSLRAEDVRVTEDGAAQQITSFAAPRDAARSIVVAIDNSMSQNEILPSVKRIAQALILALARPQKARFAVLSFADEATLEQNFTGDVARAQKSIEGIFMPNPEAPFVIGGVLDKQKKPAGSTSLQDALWLVGGEVFSSAPTDSRRVLVLLTDGRDTSSETKKRDSLGRLLAANAVIYAVGVGDEKNFEGD